MGDLLDSLDVPLTLRRVLASGLHRPSLGSWVRFYREALTATEDSRPWADWDRLLGLEGEYQIVVIRNHYAHGAVEIDEVAIEHYETYRPVLDELLDSPFFREVGLLVRSEGELPEIDVIDIFLRRGDAASSAASVLRSRLRRLAVALGRSCGPVPISRPEPSTRNRNRKVRRRCLVP